MRITISYYIAFNINSYYLLSWFKKTNIISYARALSCTCYVDVPFDIRAQAARHPHGSVLSLKDLPNSMWHGLDEKKKT